LFYFLAYWNQIPHWLASHGYEVFHLSLPWIHEQRRRQTLHKFLQEKSESGALIHLFFDQSSLAMIKILLSQHRYSCLSSVTLVGQDLQAEPSLSSPFFTPIEELDIPTGHKFKTPFFWHFHQIWTSHWHSLHRLGWQLTNGQADLFLQRAQFLAERDLLQKQRSPTLET
ncbi:MAG: hypothetical protein ACAH59_08610, partial [Pseudobdellovibrionaceae bacterium]